MNEMINENTAKTTQDDMMDMPFEELAPFTDKLGTDSQTLKMSIDADWT